MKEKIGVRELKNQASAIVRQIREEAAEYIITHNGTPVAILRPIEQEDIEAYDKEEALKSLNKLLELGREISAHWNSDKSAREILEEMREEESQWPL